MRLAVGEAGTDDSASGMETGVWGLEESTSVIANCGIWIVGTAAILAVSVRGDFTPDSVNAMQGSQTQDENAKRSRTRSEARR